MAKPTWTKSENQMLAKIVLTDRQVGMTFTEAYKDASRVLKTRTPEACETQWRKLKHLYVKELAQLPTKKFTPQQITKQSSKAANTKTTQTQFEALVNSIKRSEKENLKILDSGKGGTEYIVVNNEGEAGYLVTSAEGKIVDCNCPNHQLRGVVCKHIVKVALAKKLEVF